MKREHILTYRGRNYGPYASTDLMFSDLRFLLEIDELHGLEPPTDTTWITVETEEEDEDECSA